MDIWRRVPAEMRIPLLIETLERYRLPPDPDAPLLPDSDPVGQIRSGRSLNDFIIAAYRLASGRERKQLKMEPNEAESFEILRKAYHYCGHGEDTKPPVAFALRHFRRKLYSRELYDALAVYRETLKHTKHTATQRLKSEIDLILWQDPRRKLTKCWADRFKRGLEGLPASEQVQWRWLFQGFCYSTIPGPPKHWKPEVPDRCAELLLEWMDSPVDAEPLLSAPGSMVLKNVIWLATRLRNDSLDAALHGLLQLPWKKRQPLSKVAVALGYSASVLPDAEEGLRRLAEILARYGDDGSQIERMWRKAGGTALPAGYVDFEERRLRQIADQRQALADMAAGTRAMIASLLEDYPPESAIGQGLARWGETMEKIGRGPASS